MDLNQTRTLLFKNFPHFPRAFTPMGWWQTFLGTDFKLNTVLQKQYTCKSQNCIVLQTCCLLVTSALALAILENKMQLETADFSPSTAAYWHISNLSKKLDSGLFTTLYEIDYPQNRK